VRGAGFVSGSVVNWNGSPRTTTFVSAGKITAAILASDIATATTATITVKNPTPGGGLSNPGYFEVTTPTSMVTMAAYVLSQAGSLSGFASSNFAQSTFAVADFNGDGKLDIACLNGVLLGNGDGTFQSPIAFPAGVVTPGSTFFVADVNNDGKLDVVFGGSILLGNGDGSFQAPIPVSGSVVGLCVGDFNGDGKPDLVVGHFFNGDTLSILPGNGDGTFGSPIFSTVLPTESAIALAAGDFNGDGKLDLIVSEPGGQNTGPLAVYLGNGDGTLQAPLVSPEANAGGLAIAIADLNGDGNLDVLTWSFLPPNPGDVAIVLGNGDGTLPNLANDAPLANLAVIADLNGDGNLDLFGGGVQPGIGVVLGNGNASFQTKFFTAANAGVPLAVAGSGDFNGDGKMDLIATDADGRLWVLLQGLLPADTPSPTVLSFGAQSVGMPSPPQTVTLTNTGTAPLTFFSAAIGISGTDAAVFSTTNTCGASLDPGANCQVRVILNPTRQGTFSAALNIADNGIGGPFTIPLSGNSPSVSTVVLSPATMTFTLQARGLRSSPQTATLTNAGTAALSITSISITGGGAGDFAQTNTCGPTIAVGASCQITVTFTLTTGDVTETAVVSIADSAADTPQVISLTGTKLGPSVASLSPSSVIFPTQLVGTKGSSQTVTLKNTGPATLNIASITTTPGDFGNQSTCTSIVDPGQSCTIAVSFDPTEARARVGTLTVTDDADDSPQRIPLSGNGQDFSVGPSGAASATITAGQTATYTIAFAVMGGFTQPIALSCSGAPAMSMCTVTPSSLQLSGTSPVTATVTVKTTAKGFALPFWPDVPGRIKYQPTPQIFAWLGTFVMVVGLLLWRREQRFSWVPLFGLAVLGCIGMTLTSCGGGSEGNGGGSGGATSGTQAGTYAMTVSGSFTSGLTTVTHTTKLTLVVQ
jgi:FG-GAP-like repeat/Abnormal spindle-like microcephaly-assoc'd, ASPM-SPD-2-Hydin/FG-GAP repeat